MKLPAASQHGLNIVWGEKASTGTRLPACSWVERSPEAALLCHVFTWRFGSGLEGISEPWGVSREILGLRMQLYVLSMEFRRQK